MDSFKPSTAPLSSKLYFLGGGVGVAGLLKVRERGSNSDICSQAQIKMQQAQLGRKRKKCKKINEKKLKFHRPQDFSITAVSLIAHCVP